MGFHDPITTATDPVARQAAATAQSRADAANTAAANANTAAAAAQSSADSASYAANHITSTQITDGAISTPKLAAGAVTANELAAGAVTADKLTATAIDGKTITGVTVSGGTVTGALIRATGTGDVTATSTGHAIQAGPTSGINVAIDGNEVGARNNGAWSQLFLNFPIINNAQQSEGASPARRDYVDGLVSPLQSATTDSGWVTVSTATGYFRQNSIDPMVRKIGNVVFMRWGWGSSGMVASSTFTVGTIPAGYRPAQDVYCRPGVNNAANDVQGVIYTTGAVEIRTGATLPAYVLFSGICWTVN
jgi:hypothetical protein